MTTTDLPTDAPAGRRRRAELGEFLKARRARLRPEDVGLPPGIRRRTSGLRREEVALLAGVGVTWYTWLEQGRPINASGQVLDAVARTLRLERAEREHLYQLAEATPTRAESSTAVPEEIIEVLASLDPLPASVVNGRYDVLASNGASEDLFWEWHSMPCVHKNHIWCCVTEPLARERLLNYDTEVPHLIARMRAEYVHHVGEPEWEEDIRRLLELSAEFAEIWARHEVAEPMPRLRRYNHPDAGEVTLVNTELIIAARPDLRLTVSTPADAETWQRLPLTRRIGERKKISGTI